MGPGLPPSFGTAADGWAEMFFLAAGQSERGPVRTTNEDFVLVAEDLGLVLVADGIGGRAGGEVASRLAGETIAKELRQGESDEDNLSLIPFLCRANASIRAAGSENPALEGMGSTIVAGLFNEGRMAIAWVGDCRAYLVRDGRIELLTRDHTLVAEQISQGLLDENEAAESPWRHMVTRALGVAEEVVPEEMHFSPKDGDHLLLCSDGLTGGLPEQVLLTVLRALPPKQACRMLLNAAIEGGSNDNVTAVVVRFFKNPLRYRYHQLAAWLRR